MRKLSKPAVLSVLLLWAGAGLMFGAITARTLFDASVLDDRELSGALVGAILRRYYAVSYYALGFCALVSMLGWLVDLKHRRKMRFLFFLCVLLFAANAIQDKVIRTEMVRLKLEIKNTFEPARQEALQQRFDELHKWSTTLFGGSTLLAIAAACGVLFLWDREPRKTARKTKSPAPKAS
jgi:hypothetical protein